MFFLSTTNISKNNFEPNSAENLNNLWILTDNLGNILYIKNLYYIDTIFNAGSDWSNFSKKIPFHRVIIDQPFLAKNTLGFVSVTQIDFINLILLRQSY